MGISFLQVMEYLSRRAFLAAGLCPQTVALPCEGCGTRTIHYWAPPRKPCLPPLLLIHVFGTMATWQWRPSESWQAAALPGLASSAWVAVAGTTYGGFVAYSLACAAGPGRVGPVVISNSDLLKMVEDDRALPERAGRRVGD